tara:strand:- start:878 stop:1393 length:516 start_codon:yes stop_codon:yes gene_type:complete
MSRDGVVRGSKRVIRLNPAVETSAYANADVLFHSLEIPRAVIEKGGCSKLISGFLVCEGADVPIGYLVFSEKTLTLGTVNATADVSHANFITANPLATIYTDGNVDTDSAIDNVNMRQFYGKSTGAEEFSLPVLLQADTDSTSVYVGMIADQSGITFDNTDSLQVILHIED